MRSVRDKRRLHTLRLSLLRELHEFSLRFYHFHHHLSRTISASTSSSRLPRRPVRDISRPVCENAPLSLPPRYPSSTNDTPDDDVARYPGFSHSKSTCTASRVTFPAESRAQGIQLSVRLEKEKREVEGGGRRGRQRGEEKNTRGKNTIKRTIAETTFDISWPYH